MNSRAKRARKRARLLHRSLALAKVTQVIDGLTSSIDHVDLEADGCEASLWESQSGAGSRYLEVFFARIANNRAD